MLTQEKFDQAKRFVMTRARPLEQATFAYIFEGGPADAVTAELAFFQNEDGGFGKGLEPDLQSPLSSVLATHTALALLVEIDAAEDHPLVAGGMRFLMSQFEPDERIFRFTQAGTDAHPHAPWWQEDGLRERFSGFKINPTAESISYLYRFPAVDPDELRASLLAEMIDRIERQTEPLDINSIQVLMRLSETPRLPGRDAFAQKVETLCRLSVQTDPTRWGEYGLSPVDVVRSPDAPLFSELESLVAQDLEFVTSQQDENGSWGPAWSWGGRFDEDWPQAEQAWRGVITIEILHLLKNFNRIEGL